MHKDETRGEDVWDYSYQTLVLKARPAVFCNMLHRLDQTSQKRHHSSNSQRIPKSFCNIKRLLLSHLDIPLKTAGQCRVRQVGGTYICSRKARISFKEIRLGMHSRMVGFIINFDSGIRKI